MLSTVESLDADHHSLARTSLGLSTPACLVRCHDVHRASGKVRCNVLTHGVRHVCLWFLIESLLWERD